MAILKYADESIQKDLVKLEKRDNELYRHIKNAFMNIQEDPVCGIQIHFRQIPKRLKKKYFIDNLYKYNLPNAWRLLYSLMGNKIEIIAIVLGCYNHKDYNRLFNYN